MTDFVCFACRRSLEQGRLICPHCGECESGPNGVTVPRGSRAGIRPSHDRHNDDCPLNDPETLLHPMTRGLSCWCSDVKDHGLTGVEGGILKRLVSVWESWLLLPDRRPDDDTVFRMAIHSCQQMIAMRSVRRDHPELWGQ